MNVIVEVFTSTGCSHCASLITLMADRLKAGDIAELSLANLSVNPERGSHLDIRSVPTFTINGLQFEGAMSAKDLDGWIEDAKRGRGPGRYFEHLLSSGRRHQVATLLVENTSLFPDLIKLIRADHSVDIRLGVAATLEDLAERPLIHAATAPLIELADSHDARERADACHLLSLIDSDEARSALNEHRQDPDADVREIVIDALGP